MKNKLIAIVVVGLIATILSARFVGAQTDSPTPKASPTASSKPTPKDDTEKKAENLKEKIAAKVSQLTKEQKTAIVGTVSDNKKSTIDLTVDNQVTLSVAVDDTVTKLFDLTSGKKRIIEIGNIKKGDYLVASGPRVENTVSANIIYRDNAFSGLSGQITNTNSDDFTIDLVTTDRVEMTLDIEKTTKQSLVDSKTLQIKKVGFGKIKIGDTIHFVFKPISKKNRVSALRILIIPQEIFEK